MTSRKTTPSKGSGGQSWAPASFRRCGILADDIHIALLNCAADADTTLRARAGTEETAV